MNGKISYKVFQFNDKPEDFFKWCIDNRLFKVTKKDGFRSRMKMYYQGEIEFTGLTSIVAFEEDKPIAIMHCEHDDHYHPAFLIKNIFNIKIVKAKEFDWGYYNMGMISIYVKKKYRKNGIATNLFSQMEEFRLHTLKDKQDYNPLSMPLFHAKEMAYDIVLNKAKYSLVTDKDEKYTNYKHDIHQLTTGLIEQRDGEPYPLYPLRKMKNFIPQQIIIDKSKIITCFEKPMKAKNKI